MDDFCQAIEERFDADFIGASLRTEQFEDQTPVNRYQVVMRRPDGSHLLCVMNAHHPEKQSAIESSSGEGACFAIRHKMQPWVVDTSVVQTRDIQDPKQYIEQVAPEVENQSSERRKKHQ